jgi:hypothetical protein
MKTKKATNVNEAKIQDAKANAKAKAKPASKPVSDQAKQAHAVQLKLNSTAEAIREKTVRWRSFAFGFGIAKAALKDKAKGYRLADKSDACRYIVLLLDAAHAAGVLCDAAQPIVADVRYICEYPGQTAKGGRIAGDYIARLLMIRESAKDDQAVAVCELLD